MYKIKIVYCCSKDTTHHAIVSTYNWFLIIILTFILNCTENDLTKNNLKILNLTPPK